VAQFAPAEGGGHVVAAIAPDQLGQPLRLIEDAGGGAAVSWQRVPLPFGATHALAAEPLVEEPTRLPGQYEDAATGLHYNYWRDYDPRLGRYLQPDPIGLAGGDVNLYAYVRNDPLNWSDPTGLDFVLAGFGYSAVAPGGHEQSVGVAYDFVCDELSVFRSLGLGAGLNASTDYFVGYVWSDGLSGITMNANISLGPVSFTFFKNPATGALLGMTIGAGPGAPLPAQGSITRSETWTGPLDRFIAYEKGKLGLQ